MPERVAVVTGGAGAIGTSITIAEVDAATWRRVQAVNVESALWADGDLIMRKPARRRAYYMIVVADPRYQRENYHDHENDRRGGAGCGGVAHDAGGGPAGCGPAHTWNGQQRRWPRRSATLARRCEAGPPPQPPRITRPAAGLAWPGYNQGLTLNSAWPGYNQGLTLDEALERCRALDGEGLAWIEEPLR